MKRLFASIFALCFSFILVSCGIQDISPTTQMSIPTSSSTPTFGVDDLAFQKVTVDLNEAPDGLGAVYVASNDMEIAQYQRITYAFAPSISLYDRQRCIQATATIAEKVGVTQNLQINIYTPKPMATRL